MADPEGGARPASILVVDDTTANLQLLTQLLTAHGYAVHPASDGELALEYVRAELPDLVMLDIRMPGMDGYEVCRRLKADPLTRAIPVIFVSALDDEPAKVEAFRRGAVDYVTKPFQPEEVLARIRIHLRVRELTERLEQKVGERTTELSLANRRLQQEIAERRQAEEQVRRLAQDLERRVRERTADLEAANRELEAFAYSVSHDLRAPLRHIVGFIALLERHAEGALDEKSRHYAQTISGAATALGTMIDDLLSFSRLGRADMTKGAVDLGALVEDVVRTLAPEAEGRSVAWRIGRFPAVNADGRMLRLAVTNLVSNALKFTRREPRAEIEIGCAERREGDGAAGGETVVFVRDNGVGFDDRYAEKLFKVFQRLHRPEDFEGTGIGLANVRRIVERHGGRVWAEGAPGRGATFYFSLPGGGGPGVGEGPR